MSRQAGAKLELPANHFGTGHSVRIFGIYHAAHRAALIHSTHSEYTIDSSDLLQSPDFSNRKHQVI